MKAILIKTPEQLYKLKFYNDEDMLACATALLSKQNCDEIFGVVDVDVLATEHYKEYDNLPIIRFNSFTKGFNKAMELHKDKVFTIEDMHDAVMLGVCFENPGIQGISNYNEAKDLAIKRALKPIEIEVEIEMKNSRTGKVIKSEADLEWDEDGLCDRAIPKLDSDGCLILKRK